MILNQDELKSKLTNRDNIQKEILAGKLIPLRRGLYETDANASVKYLAGKIHNPSYISLDYVLSAYSLIPEAVYSIPSATSNKSKIYNNAFGCFIYSHIPQSVYSLGIKEEVEGGCSYLIATPEKALCDKLYSLPVVSSLSELTALLFDDLRIDEEELLKLNKVDLVRFANLYKSKNLNLFAEFINKNKYRQA